jgi:hypothetical protein
VAFFRNDTVNLLNLHYGIHTLALSGGGTFFAAYLLRSGVPAPAVLAALAAILAGRFVIRPFVLLPARRFGLKPLVIAGTVMTGLQYPLLAEVRGVGWELVALCAITSAGDTVYWTCYHAYFASLGDADHRGHQLGAREAIAAIVGIIGPLATGWTLTTLGPKVAFDATAVVLLLGALPILGTRNVPVADTAPGAFRAAALGLLMFMADGWIAAGFFFVWQMALFLALGESFTAYGGAMALAALVGASGRAGASPLRTDHDDRRLQSSEGVALRAALPHRHRGRLGRRRGERMYHCRRPALGRRAYLARDSAVAARSRSGFCAAAGLLWRSVKKRASGGVARIERSAVDGVTGRTSHLASYADVWSSLKLMVSATGVGSLPAPSIIEERP